MGLFGKKKKAAASAAPVREPVRGESGGVLVLGSGCAKCNALEQAAIAALEELGMDETVGHVTDFSQIAAYGVMTPPALVVDGKVVSTGQVLTVQQAKALIEKARG